MTSDRLLRTLFILIWVLVIANAVAEHWYLYWVYRWLDMPMHVLGGVWLGLAGLWLWYWSGLRVARMSAVPAFVVALGAGVLAGVAWEGYEFVLWQLSGKGLPAHYLTDTFTDLSMDTLGAFLAYWVARIRGTGMPAPSA